MEGLRKRLERERVMGGGERERGKAKVREVCGGGERVLVRESAAMSPVIAIVSAVFLVVGFVESLS